MRKLLLYVANRIWLIIGIYLLSLLLAAGLFALLEGKSFSEGLWWATVTALTVGYGDLTPLSTAGRVMGIAFGHFWIFVVIPMIIANIILHLVEDKDAFTHEEQLELMARLQAIEQRLDVGSAEGPPLPHRPELADKTPNTRP